MEEEPGLVLYGKEPGLVLYGKGTGSDLSPRGASPGPHSPRGSTYTSTGEYNTPTLGASDDGESIGHCPFCQRLFMILLLKGIPFTLTTVDMKRALDVLKDFAPGAQLPVLLYNGEPKTDTNKIEEFLEETLGPPNFPSLVPRYKESSTAGNDIFHKFSVFIKNSLKANRC
uniref:Chloride intracellular channel 3 n=1 Tax=Chelonoidis abingdonii TaxID=106734 RepID=A0A8C0G528_CHEAB